MKALVGAFNQEKALVGAFSVIVKPMDHYTALLQEENVRLKEESQTAAQQLRRFTEWFFQTIDKS